MATATRFQMQNTLFCYAPKILWETNCEETIKQGACIFENNLKIWANGAAFADNYSSGRFSDGSFVKQSFVVNSLDTGGFVSWFILVL